MHSLWWETCQIQERQTLKENLETEILVIGGGMAGILTAYQLHKAGKKVLVLEADRIGSGQTRNTTAKITSQHGLCYHGFLKKLGTEKARIYASANQAAIQEYENIINTEQIACDFEKQSSFVYGKSKKDLELEVQAATSLGLPASLVQENLTLPFPVWGAVTFQNQAQFHPLKFLYSLSEHLVIYEHSPVYKVEENTAYTKSGTVKAEKIIFTCHIPFLNFPGAYFARIHQERSYVLALEDHGMKTNGMYIGSGKQSFSFRNYRWAPLYWSLCKKQAKLVRCSWISKMGYDKFHGCSYTLEGFDFRKRQSLGRCIYTQTLFLCRYSFFVQGRRTFCKRSYQTIAGLPKPRKASCLPPHGMSIGVESRRRKLGLSLSRFQI